MTVVDTITIKRYQNVKEGKRLLGRELLRLLQQMTVISLKKRARMGPLHYYSGCLEGD